MFPLSRHPLLTLAWLWLPCALHAQIRTTVGLTIPQSGGGPTLTANLYAPDPSSAGAPHPVVSMLPGGGASLSSVEWAAQRLARDGYVVCLTLPQLSSEDAYARACVSGLDFLASPANPYAADSDNTRAGICGWSLGGRSLVKVQAEDARVDAMVCWDNLAVSEKGDGGSPLGSNRPNPIRTPRVPAMGQASLNGFTNSDAKLTAWKWWREHGMPCFQVTFAGSNHFWWSGSASTETQRNQSHHYTLAWFDRWLKGDKAATARLLATTVAGASVESLLSGGIRSAAYLDGIDTADLRSHLVTDPGGGFPQGARPARWVCSGGSSAGNEVARALDCDPAGNLITVGSVQGAVTITGPLGAAAFPAAAGAEDIFVVKNAPDGTILWMRRYGGGGSDFAYDVAVDGAGRIFVTGTFQGSFGMGAFPLATPAGTTATFTAELDASGNVVWAGVTGAAPAGAVISSEVIADGAGGFIVCGGFTGTADFSGTAAQAGAGLHAYIARYGSERALRWLATADGASVAARGLALASDGSGDLIATGQFAESARFGDTELLSAGGTDAWLARLDANGNWRWAKRAGGGGEDYGRGVAATAAGYGVSGSFSGTDTTLFGAGSASSLGARDVYAVMFGWDDLPVWMRSLGGGGDDEGAEISTMPDGGFALCGSFAGTMTHGSHSQTSGGARDLMVARLSPQGAPGWLAGTLGGAGDDVGYACATDATGNVHFAGYFSTIAPFGYDVAVSPTKDTFPNQQEIVWGKIHATSEPDDDSDGDGQKNAAELAAGTGPLDPASLLRIEDVVRSGNSAQVSWQSIPGRSYRIESSPDLSPASWSSIGSASASSTRTSLVVPAAPAGNGALYFRVTTP